MYKQLCAALEPTEIGEVIKAVETDCEEFYKKYLHDFVRFAHLCKHKDRADENKEYEVFHMHYVTSMRQTPQTMHLGLTLCQNIILYLLYL